MNGNYALDSYALLALLRAEPGAPRVRQLLQLAQRKACNILMSYVNLGEVLYHVERRHGAEAARETLTEIESLPVQMVAASRERVLAAAHLKANYPIAYADAFAAALCREQDATLVTGDPEFRALGSAVRVEWLPVREEG